ncbi:MAG: 3-hydroxybutyrate dehydrogenase, partial [Pseudomonadota bacterium]
MLEGKVALITGSTSGIGLGIAEALAKSGAKVMLNGLGDPKEIERIRARLAAEAGVEVGFHGANMLAPDDIADLVAKTHDSLGGLDILVNNAGIQYVAPIEDFPTEKWDAILGINLSAAFHTIRHAVPIMKKAGWGRIINIASAHALVASPFKAAYVAAKHGLYGLTKTVALEVAQQGITANAICPGYVLTPLVEKQIPDTARARGISEEAVKRDVLLAAQPTKEFVTIAQIAETALFLCGAAGASINGSALAIDGGWTA